MAKQQTDVFRGLLTGVDFMRNIQKDAKEEDRYQDQFGLQKDEFALRKDEARKAAERWREKMDADLDMFNQNMEFNKDKLKIDDENADLDRELQSRKAAALEGYYKAMERSMTGAADKADEQEDRLEAYKDIDYKLNQAGTSYNQDLFGEKVKYESSWIDDIKDLAPNPFVRGSTSKRAETEAKNVALNEATATDVLDSMSGLLKVIANVKANKFKLHVTDFGGNQAVRQAESAINQAVQAANNGYIKNKDLKKEIAEAAKLLQSVRATAKQKEVLESASSPYNKAYNTELGKGYGGLEIKMKEQELIEEGYLEEE